MYSPRGLISAPMPRLIPHLNSCFHLHRNGAESEGEGLSGGMTKLENAGGNIFEVISKSIIRVGPRKQCK